MDMRSGSEGSPISRVCCRKKIRRQNSESGDPCPLKSRCVKTILGSYTCVSQHLREMLIDGFAPPGVPTLASDSDIGVRDFPTCSGLY